jgi:uncharacterized protein (TIGR04255 family)
MSTSVDLIKTPLAEATIEVRFRGDARIDAWRGEFQAAIQDKYPILSVPNLSEGDAPALKPYRFENEARTAAVGLAINSYFHTAREYPGWRRFSANALESWQIVNEAIAPALLSRVGIRYINQFSGELLGEVDKSFEAPFLRPLKDQPRAHQGATLRGDEDSGLVIRVDYDRDEMRLTIDVDVFEKDVAPDDLHEKVMGLHDILEEQFFSVLEPAYAAKLKATARE